MELKPETEPDTSCVLSLLKERANETQPGFDFEGKELTWNSIMSLGDRVTAVGPSFGSTTLGQSSKCRYLNELLSSTESWRQSLAAARSADLVLVDHSIWDHPSFVQDGLAQLCHVLVYRGHFLWIGGPAFWPRRAQTRASILRLCSLHGLRLVRQVRIQPGQARQPAMRGWLLQRRDPIHTLVHG